jgi:hypothetical protein
MARRRFGSRCGPMSLSPTIPAQTLMENLCWKVVSRKNERIWSDTYEIKSIFKTNCCPLLQKLSIIRLISIWRILLVFIQEHAHKVSKHTYDSPCVYSFKLRCWKCLHFGPQTQCDAAKCISKETGTLIINGRLSKSCAESTARCKGKTRGEVCSRVQLIKHHAMEVYGEVEL